jgi:hypothetical protein
MKKIKAVFIAIAIITALSSAFAFRPCATCQASQQYYWNGSGYVRSGILGVNYYCQSAAGWCTYYLPDPNNPTGFAPCQPGYYTPF